MRKIANFCGVFATLFVTTTIVFLASCSQDDDYYENSEMYTLAEMGTRLGAGDEWHPGSSILHRHLRPSSKNDTIQIDGMDVIFTISWPNEILAGDTVQITSVSHYSTITQYYLDENDNTMSVNKCKYIGHDIPSLITTYLLGHYYAMGHIYYKEAIVDPYTQHFLEWRDVSTFATINVDVNDCIIWE